MPTRKKIELTVDGVTYRCYRTLSNSGARCYVVPGLGPVILSATSQVASVVPVLPEAAALLRTLAAELAASFRARA